MNTIASIIILPVAAWLFIADPIGRFDVPEPVAHTQIVKAEPVEYGFRYVELNRLLEGESAR